MSNNGLVQTMQKRETISHTPNNEFESPKIMWPCPVPIATTSSVWVSDVVQLVKVVDPPRKGKQEHVKIIYRKIWLKLGQKKV